MRIQIGRGLVIVLMALAATAAAGESSGPQKAPVPQGAALEASQKAAADLYGDRFRSAKTATDKTSVAADMTDAALQLQDGSADQYVLLKIAREIAAGAGDAAAALRAAEKQAERFDVSAAKLKAETLLTAAREAATTAQHKAVAEAALQLVDNLADEDEIELALDVCEAGRAAASKSRQSALVKEMAAKAGDLKKQQAAFLEYRRALAVMENEPAEPAANLAAGRYLCLVKGDWVKGVPMLALGSDAALKAVALMELRGADSAEQQAAIGNAWWDAAETRQGAERDTLRLRAGTWYQQAAPKLTGELAGLKIKQRLEQLASMGREVPEPPRSAPRDKVVSKPARLAPGLVLRVFPKQLVQDDNRYEAHVLPAQFGQPVGPPLIIATSEYKHDVSTNAIAFGYLRIDVAGDYTFETSTGYDRAALYLDAKAVNPFRDGEAKQATVHLEPGMVPIAIVGWTIYDHVRTRWLPPGATEPTLIPTPFLFHDPNQPIPSLVQNPDAKGHLPAEVTPAPAKPVPEPTPSPAPKAVTGTRQPAARVQPGRELAGLIGRARASGNDVGLVLRYQPGQIFPQQTFDDLLAKQGIPSRDIQIELGGALRLDKTTSVLVAHKGGSGDRGVLHLYLNGRELGVVGDNHTKDTTYQVELPSGLHVIRWVLTGGAIGGGNMIQFVDSRTNQPLPVHVPAEAAAQVRSMPFKSEVDVSRN